VDRERVRLMLARASLLTLALWFLPLVLPQAAWNTWFHGLGDD